MTLKKTLIQFEFHRKLFNKEMLINYMKKIMLIIIILISFTSYSMK